MGITSASFADLQRRLLAHLRQAISNGELTERAFARRCGISQPHMHHLLKGTRTLTAEVTDILLVHLGLSPLDLFSRDELILHLSNTNPHRENRLRPVPALSGLLGLNHPAPRKGPHREIHSVPYHLTEVATDPIVVSLAHDPEMEPLFAANDLVLLDQSEAARTLFQSQGYYVVRTPAGLCVRSLLRDGDALFLISERNRAFPDSWTRLPIAGDNLLDLVIARVIWLNRRRRWEDHVA